MSLTQVSIDAATLARLDATAAANAASREEALKEAIDNYCEYDRWFRRQVDKGLEDIREGRVLSSKEVDQRAELRRVRLLKSKRMFA